MAISSNELSFIPSVAGFWHTVSNSLLTAKYSGAVATKLYAALPVGAEGREGLIAGGWSYNGFDNQATDTIPVSMLVLEQQADGTMLVKTSDYLANAQTKGVGAVLVADFNGDGFLDAFLAGHNESPFISRPSIALMGNTVRSLAVEISTTSTRRNSVLNKEAGNSRCMLECVHVSVRMMISRL